MHDLLGFDLANLRSLFYFSVDFLHSDQGEINVIHLFKIFFLIAILKSSNTTRQYRPDRYDLANFKITLAKIKTISSTCDRGIRHSNNFNIQHLNHGLNRFF